ncbi:MAG: pilus assembly protein [Chloroflexi bacterium]|nr:MAG: pilus assembly protein [Chloroflexota bacterium]TMD74070.1 MAG: pilus assembly protein [Chloroflexota bacterium]
MLNKALTHRHDRSRAQAMTEFAIVAPILFFLLLGIVESGLLLFVVGSARFGGGEIARQESESGNAVNADSISIQQLQRTAIGTTTLAEVTEIDIYRLIEQGNGSLLVDALHYNRYQLNGTPIGAVMWPSSSRNVTNGQSDFLGVTLQYKYKWKTGIFIAPTAINLTQTFDIRLEPQTY